MQNGLYTVLSNSSEASVLGVFGIESKRNSDSQDEELKHLFITTKDVCDNDIVSDFCLVKLGDIVKSFTKERLEKKNKDFFCPNVVFNNFSNQTTRVDVVFDRYLRKKSIKAFTQSTLSFGGWWWLTRPQQCPSKQF